MASNRDAGRLKQDNRRNNLAQLLECINTPPKVRCVSMQA